MSDVIAAVQAGEDIPFGTMTPRLADGAYYIGQVNDVEFNIVSSYTGGRDVLNAINADDVDIGWVAGPQAAGVTAGDLVNPVNGEDQPHKVSTDAQTLADIGVDFFSGATFVAVAPDGLPDYAQIAISDAIATVIQQEGTKSNEIMARVFALKVLTEDEAQPYVAGELADAQAVLDATAE